MSADVRGALRELKSRTGRRAAVLAVDRLGMPDLYPVFEALRDAPRGALDVVLYTTGGDVDATRRIGRFLRAASNDLRVLVPDAAQSAGTLLCLAADTIATTRMTMLGPIDPQMPGSGGPQAGPGTVSALELRALTDVGVDWYAMSPKDAAISAGEAVRAAIFPTVLSRLHRAEVGTRSAARELLALRREPPDPATADELVEQLMTAFSSHGHPLDHEALDGLGLPVERLEPELERLAWSCWAPLRAWLLDETSCEPSTTGVVATSDGFLAQRRADAPRWVVLEGARDL